MHAYTQNVQKSTLPVTTAGNSVQQLTIVMVLVASRIADQVGTDVVESLAAPGQEKDVESHPYHTRNLVAVNLINPEKKYAWLQWFIVRILMNPESVLIARRLGNSFA